MEILRENFLRHVSLLQHSSHCSGNCPEEVRCSEMKGFIDHYSVCCSKDSCYYCKYIKDLILEHANGCEAFNCPIEGCNSLRLSGVVPTVETSPKPKKRGPYKCSQCKQIKTQGHRCPKYVDTSNQPPNTESPNISQSSEINLLRRSCPTFPAGKPPLSSRNQNPNPLTRSYDENPFKTRTPREFRKKVKKQKVNIGGNSDSDCSIPSTLTTETENLFTGALPSRRLHRRSFSENCTLNPTSWLNQVGNSFQSKPILSVDTTVYDNSFTALRRSASLMSEDSERTYVEESSSSEMNSPCQNTRMEYIGQNFNDFHNQAKESFGFPLPPPINTSVSPKFSHSEPRVQSLSTRGNSYEEIPYSPSMIAFFKEEPLKVNTVSTEIPSPTQFNELFDSAAAHVAFHIENQKNLKNQNFNRNDLTNCNNQQQYESNGLAAVQVSPATSTQSNAINYLELQVEEEEDETITAELSGLSFFLNEDN